MSWLMQDIPDPHLLQKPTVPALVCSVLVLCPIPIAQIVIGAMYLHDCPREPYIPIYLIVVGAFNLLLVLLSCLLTGCQPEGRTINLLRQVSTGWNSLTTLFLFGWFIAGNVWIYSIYEPNYNKNTTNVDPYCDRTLYLFAFWITNLVYIFLGLILVCGCCYISCFCCLRRHILGFQADQQRND